MSGPSWRGKEPPPELARKIDRMEAMKEDPNETDIVPGLSRPAQPLRKKSDDNPGLARVGLVIGGFIVGVIAVMLLAIVVIILIGVAHGLWELFF